MVQECPSSEVLIRVSIRSTCRYSVFERVESFFDIQPLLVIEVNLLRGKIKIAAEREVAHPDLFQDIGWFTLLLAVILLHALNVVAFQPSLSGIVPEGVDEVASVAAGTLHVPDCTLVVGEDIIPFAVISVLVE